MTPTAPGHATLASGMPPDVLRHLGGLLEDAFGPSDPDTFADLLAKLDVAFRDAGGDRDSAFQLELLTCVPVLRRFAASLTRDPTAADDLMQDALLRAWRSRAGFALGTNMQAWTFTILRNQFYSDRRKLGREVQDEEGVHAARLATIPDQTDRLDLTDVQAALGRLPPEIREALVLITVSGVTYEKAAMIMGCQLGTVKSRVNRGRRRLAKVLGYDIAEIGQDPLTLSAIGSPA